MRLLMFALLACTSPADANTNNTGGAAMQFLRIGAGARALGMGEAYGPVAEGPAAVYWNPAGLAQMSSPEVAYSHIELLTFFHHDYFAYGHPIHALQGTIAGALTLFYEDPQDLVTNTNQKIGTFNNHSETFSLAYARGFRIGEDWGTADRSHFDDLWRVGGAEMPLRPRDDVWNGNLLTGLAFKIVRSTLHDRSARAVALDGGVIFRHTYFNDAKLSFTFRNAGTKARYITKSQTLPTEVTFGTAYDHKWGRQRLLPALEVSWPLQGPPSVNAGFEYSFPAGEFAVAAFRGGYKTLPGTGINNLAGITGGVGFGYRHLSLDFGFQPGGGLGGTYRIETGYRF